MAWASGAGLFYASRAAGIALLLDEGATLFERVDHVPNPPQDQKSLNLGHIEVVGGDDVGDKLFKLVQGLTVLVQRRVDGN